MGVESLKRLAKDAPMPKKGESKRKKRSEVPVRLSGGKEREVVLREWKDGSGKIRIGRALVDQLKGKEDVSLWTDEELMQGCKNSMLNGKTTKRIGVPPAVIPSPVYIELISRIQSRVRFTFAAEVEYAVETHMQLIKMWRTDMEEFGESSIPAAVLLKAIEMLYDRVIGKPEEHMIHHQGEPWTDLVANAIVGSEDQLKDAELRAQKELESGIIDVEPINDDDDDDDDDDDEEGD